MKPKRGRKPSDPPIKGRLISLTDDQWSRIRAIGGSKAVREWAESIKPIDVIPAADQTIEVNHEPK